MTVAQQWRRTLNWRRVFSVTAPTKTHVPRRCLLEEGQQNTYPADVPV
jgi:hypothetical protein